MLFSVTIGDLFAAFKELVLSARVASLGSSFVAVVDGSDGLLFNPAGRIKEGVQFSFSRANLFQNLDLYLGDNGRSSVSSNYLACSFNTQNRLALGFVYNQFDVQDLYNEQQYSVNLSYLLLDEDNLLFSIGWNVNFLSNTFQDTDVYAKNDSVFEQGNSQSIISYDAGLLLTIDEFFSIGFAWKHINSPDIGLQEEDKIPSEYSGGVRFFTQYWAFLDSLSFSLDAYYRDEVDPDIQLRSGIELGFFHDQLFIRSGTNIRSVSMGFGIDIGDWFSISLTIDYALSLQLKMEDDPMHHRVSASLKFY